MSDEVRTRTTEALNALRRLLQMVEAGELDATPARVWYLRGAADALEALLAGDSAAEAPTTN
jgi:hypothetical protein